MEAGRGVAPRPVGEFVVADVTRPTPTGSRSSMREARSMRWTRRDGDADGVDALDDLDAQSVLTGSSDDEPGGRVTIRLQSSGSPRQRADSASFSHSASASGEEEAGW